MRSGSNIAAATGGSLTLGVVSGLPGKGWSETEARALADCLQVRLGVPVAVRLFQDLGVLRDWLSRYRQVDLALLPADYVGSQPAGEFFPLAELHPAGKASSDELVMRQGLAAGLPQRIGGKLSDLSPQLFQDRCASPPVTANSAPTSAAAKLRILVAGPAAPPSPAAPLIPAKPLPHPQPLPAAKAKARPAVSAGRPVTLGLVPNWNALIRYPGPGPGFQQLPGETARSGCGGPAFCRRGRTLLLVDP